TNNNTGPDLGNYTFKGITYKAKSVTRFNESISVQDYSGTIVPASNTSLVFFFSSFPTTSGSYQVIPGGIAPTAPGQVAILFAGSSYSYNYFGAPSVSGTADVTVDSVGKVSVFISNPVTLVGQGAAYDSASFTVAAVRLP
ncbi:MAG: hypothetical protein JWO03_1199, partial [Bacteroidetes bacterium]|nr:hypothetical protein [Bacteroidota bacterium]